MSIGILYLAMVVAAFSLFAVALGGVAIWSAKPAR
jgi:hypothetical protein